MKAAKHSEWWRNAVTYQIYVRSFFDSNGDGVGDLPGIIQKLDYLQSLGVDALWLSPLGTSPNFDWGYDTTGYCEIAPELGTMEDLEQLVSEARTKGIRIVMDLVPNHTSIFHPWFVEARASRDNPKRDWYIWADKPNNWGSSFGGSAWRLDKTTDQYYLHNFLPQQADLNWSNPEVQAEFSRILRFWFDKGVAGFRIDVVNMLAKDPLLQDNPPATLDDPRELQLMRQRPVHSGNGSAVHAILREWHDLAREYAEPRLLLGETMVYTPREMASYYGRSNELDMAFNFPFWMSDFDATSLRAIVAETEVSVPSRSIPVWAASNHDISRAASRWAGGDERKLRLALLLTMTLRGSAVLYYGEELGMTDTLVPRWRFRDTFGKTFWPLYWGRDRARTPMVWGPGKWGGFTPGKVRPWLPLGSRRRNVDVQSQTDLSTLAFTQRLIAMRKGTADFADGDYHELPSPDGLWAFRRGKRTVVVLNFSGKPATYASEPARRIFETPHADADVTAHSEPQRTWQVNPWEGLVLTASADQE